MHIGPIQVLAFTFDSVEHFKGEILRELDLLRGHGLIRIIDLLFVMKEQDGSVVTLQSSDLLDVDVEQFGSALRHMLGLEDTDEVDVVDELLAEFVAPEQGWSIEDLQATAETVALGTAAAWLLVEHAWALGLSTAIRNAQGSLVVQGFLTRNALLAVGHELNAMVEAEVAIEQAAALKGAAILDALITVAAAEEVQQAAAAQAVASVVGVEAFRTVVAAEAVRALIVAGLLEESDAPEAIDTLVDADLITVGALSEASQAADLALAELAAGLGDDDAA
ncbi:MAG: hypothetical protein HC911_14535 [Chloroflexaceae bacterium]|nr:hypothetical protein [Chloroflexaceae bacterium]